MKKIRLNIFAKTFIIATVMMLIITMIAYVVLYMFLPHFYKNYKTNQYDELTTTLIAQLENAKSISEEKEYLTNFVQKTSSSITVFNQDESVFFNLSVHQGFELSEEFVVFSEEVANNSLEQTEIKQSVEENEYINFEYSYTANKQARHMQIIVALQPLNEAKEVIVSIYPIAGLFCIIFSFVLASLFSHSFVKPIRKIRKATSKMTLLEPNVAITIKSNDEIGELCKDINNLYGELHGTILALEKEIKIYTDLENKKIDFLRTVSHELKTPLASANALIEGIIYEVSPYCDNPNKYLSECKSFLDKAIALTKESLNLNPNFNENAENYNLKKLIDEVFPLYSVIVKSKQIHYETHIPSDIYIKTKVKVFSHALSNVFSNAVNYTPANGQIDIKYSTKNQTLIIENTCTPLTDDELNTLSLPFRYGKINSDISNGLGLHIIKQILGSLEIKYSFLPMEGGEGMRFVIFMPCSD